MQRALDLASLGGARVRPNPMVGCVIVHEGRIIGEGWHLRFGGPHAEVEAINSVTEPELLAQSTLYVTLEPCSHFGKTPPCADLILEKQIPKVVICNHDPNPLVAGRGIRKLKEAGVHVSTGVLEQEGRWLNRRFFTLQEQNRPHVVLKWAQTADGFIARSDFSSKWISSELARNFVHQWRAEEAAIMVGTNTSLHDNPRLNVRDWPGPQPTRVVIDKNLRLPESLHLFDQSQPTLVYTFQEKASTDNLTFVTLSKESAFLLQLLTDLKSRGILSLLVEGGAQLLCGFLEENLWDEARVFVSQNRFGSGVKAPTVNLSYLTDQQQVADDILFTYQRSITN
jgi:diaminohydroxyphosphoribosylaminopyrimidine deaminase/5-amino-6-(5-phosphoribosylamino)uracil reductase